MLHEIDNLPGRLLQTPAEQLHTLLPGPTLVHLEGKIHEPLFVSVLLHGNEYSGWEIVRRFLEKNRVLNRSVSVFIGNIHAARKSERHLQDQPDYNRVWLAGDTSEQVMMQEVLTIMKQRGVFASVDIHNNTGVNPYYACVNSTDARFLNLARMFSRTVVYFLRPDSVQSMAFARLCPAVTLECGQPGDEAAIRLGILYLESCCNLGTIPDTPVSQGDIDLYHTIAIVKIKPGVSIGFGEEKADVIFADEIEQMNYREVPVNSVIANQVNEPGLPVLVTDEHNRDITGNYFRISDGKLVNSRPIIPAMFSRNKSVILADCLCYLMEYYRLDD